MGRLVSADHQQPIGFPETFSMVQMNWIEAGGKMVKKFLPKLKQRQDGNAVPGGWEIRG